MTLSSIEREILSEVIEQTKETFDNCGLGCFEDILERLEDNEEFQNLVQDKIKEVAKEEPELDEEELQAAAEGQVFTENFMAFMRKLKKETGE